MNSTFKKTAFASTVALALAAMSPVNAEEVATKGGLEVKSDDGNFKFKFGGRIQGDADLFDDKETGLGTAANKPLDFGSGTELRRMRLEAVATVNKNWEGKLEVDFRDGGGSASDTRLRDAYVAYKGFEIGNIRVGQFKTPYGLEHQTSDLFTTFVERSLIFNGITGSAEYLRGIGFNGARGNATYALEVYDAGNRDAANDRSADPGVAARFTFTPIKDKVQVVHLGLWGGREFNKTSVTAISAKPEANLADAILLMRRDAIINDADVSRLGAEAAWVNGPFTLQSEYSKMKLDGASGAPAGVGDSEKFTSYYAYVSWFVTGETRPYRAATGTWDRIVPLDAQRGAWELALRYSAIKNDDNDAEIKDITLATNYYWNSQVRLMANAIMTDASDIFAAAPIPAASTFSGKPKSLLFRIQYDF